MYPVVWRHLQTLWRKDNPRCDAARFISVLSWNNYENVRRNTESIFEVAGLDIHTYC